MMWIYEHKERECQNLTHFPHAFTGHSDYRHNQMHLSHLSLTVILTTLTVYT